MTHSFEGCPGLSNAQRGLSLAGSHTHVQVALCHVTAAAVVDAAYVDSAEHPDATPAGNRRNLSASWNAFSCGPKNCIGQALAVTEARTALAVLVANFHFDLPEGFSREQFVKHEQVWRITLQPMSQLHLKITPVNQAL